MDLNLHPEGEKATIAVSFIISAIFLSNNTKFPLYLVYATGISLVAWFGLFIYVNLDERI